MNCLGECALTFFKGEGGDKDTRYQSITSVSHKKAFLKFINGPPSLIKQKKSFNFLLGVWKCV